jgi:hypothetical protein
MTWIDEMFVTMEKDRADASARRSAKGDKKDRKERRKKQTLGEQTSWSALVASITNDVNEFNKHKKRAGQTAVHLTEKGFKCEVYLPGMHGKRLVLTLNDNDLHVTIHPEFPEQQLTITIEPDKDGQHSFWVLGDPAKEGAKLSVQQLSEYLLKPVFTGADISGEP